MKRVLLTGASGFTGPALAQALGLHATGGLVLAGRRRPVLPDTVPFAWCATGELDAGTDWRAALEGVDTVVHAAGLAHVTDPRQAGQLALFRRVNAEATAQLARCAAAAGVRRFVFISTAKVNGEATADVPFRGCDTPSPEGPYAISKWEAEQALAEVAARTGLQAVVVRPPLIYGPGVKGNLRTLAQAVARGWPLPLGAVRNRRSLVGLSNFADLVALCARHPAAAGQVFMVSDGDDPSTPELIRRMARAIGRPARLVPFPPALLRAGARLAGRSGFYERLCGDLRVDASPARHILGWTPPVQPAVEMQRLAATLQPS